MNLNWPERLFLVVVLLVAGGGILVALNALGLNIPLLSGSAPAANPLLGEEGREDAPPPLPDDAADGLLAELNAGGADPWTSAGDGPGGAESEFGSLGRGIGGEAGGGGEDSDRPGLDDDDDMSADAAKKRARAVIEELKAKTDLTDPGQLMAFLIGTFTPKGSKLGEEDLEFLLEALGAQADWGVRNLLFTHLERIGGEGVTGGLLEFLSTEKNPAALARALGALRSQNDDASVQGLVAFLAETKNRRLREAAFRNLLQTGSGAATDSLLGILDHTQDPQLKRYAIAALSQLGGRQGAETVLAYAASSDPYERALGQKSMRDIRDPAAVPALASSLGGSSDAVFRTQVVRTLGRIRDVSVVGPVSQTALYDDNRGVRMEAIRSLANVGRAEAYPALRTIAENDENANVRKAAARAVQVIEKKEAQRAAREAKKRAKQRK